MRQIRNSLAKLMQFNPMKLAHLSLNVKVLSHTAISNLNNFLLEVALPKTGNKSVSLKEVCSALAFVRQQSYPAVA